jgi:hypothetical protein
LAAKERAKMTKEQKIENLEKAIEFFGEADNLIQHSLDFDDSLEMFQEIETLISFLRTKIKEMK